MAFVEKIYGLELAKIKIAEGMIRLSEGFSIPPRHQGDDGKQIHYSKGDQTEYVVGYIYENSISVTTERPAGKALDNFLGTLTDEFFKKLPRVTMPGN